MVTSLCGVLAQFGGVTLAFAWLATLGFGGLLYAVIGVLGGLGMLAFSVQVLRNREGEAEKRAAAEAAEADKAAAGEAK